MIAERWGAVSCICLGMLGFVLGCSDRSPRGGNENRTANGVSSRHGGEASEAAQATAVNFPSGVYQASKQPDWYIEFGAADSEGSGKVAILSDGKQRVAEGTYVVSGDTVSLTDEAGKLAHTKPEEKTGRYKWSYAGGKLRFQLLQDNGKGRVLLLTTNEWKQVE